MHLAPPHHIAIVMDGNGRWAKKRFLPRAIGHKNGVESLRRCITACAQRGVRVLTVFAFSSENWNRPAEEVSSLMDLMALALGREIAQLEKEGVRLHFVGDRDAISDTMRASLMRAEMATAQNNQFILNVCFNYGGRWDITQAASKLVALQQEVNELNMSKSMALAHVPDPDLFIRTGGEQRISNFLLWQSAYSEFVFSDKLWPDFDEVALDAAIATFHQRERRFGKTSEQLDDAEHAPLAENK